VHLKKIASDNAPQGLGRGSMGSAEEPERKRRHLSNNNHSVSPPLKKQTLIAASDDKKVLSSFCETHQLSTYLSCVCY
jgi:hypothetical protein